MEPHVASSAQSLRPLRLKQFGFNRKVRHGLRKVRKAQIGCVSASVKMQKLILRGSLDLQILPRDVGFSGVSYSALPPHRSLLTKPVYRVE